MIRDHKTKMRPHNTDAFLFFIKALSFHLEYGGTYARSFNHISLSS